MSSSFTTEVFGRHWLTNKAEKKFPVRPTSIASPVEFTQRYVITGNFVECCCITTCEKERGREQDDLLIAHRVEKNVNLMPIQIIGMEAIAAARVIGGGPDKLCLVNRPIRVFFFFLE